MIVNISDISKNLRKIKEKGKYFDLFNTGLKSLDEIYQVVKGYPLFIGGNVHAGKSEFSLELCVSLAKNHGFKFACYLGEAGKPEISFIEIAQKLIGKNYFHFNEGDVIESEQFIEKHFTLLSIDDLTVRGFYDEVDSLEIKFDGTLFDPFNDAKNGTATHGGRTDIWLEEDLKYIRKCSERSNRLDVVVFHIKDINATQDKETGNWFTRPALPSEWAGGQVVNRRAFTQLLVYKVPTWFKDENGVPYGENKTIIYNQKAKPKGSGRIGNVVIGWDWKRNRYYEEIDGFRKYMVDKPTQQVAPQFPANVDFDNLIDDMPF